MPQRQLAARGPRFAIATPHRAATRAGAEAFDDGGNAIDAALAAAVTLAVVYPHMCGVGGDLFALVTEPDGRTVAVNASGAAPGDIDVGAIRAAHGRMPERGPLPITVPGTVSGWAALHRLGAALPFASAFDPGIALAREGVEVARSLAASLEKDAGLILRDGGLRGVFTQHGDVLREGAVLVQPALAATLERIAADGAETLYGGEVGARLVENLRALGSPVTLDDLARHEPDLDSPIRLAYGDLHVSVAPPNSQGFVLLEILAAVERLGIDPDPLGPDAASLARVFEAASADRDRHNADPRFARVPVGTLLDESHIAALCDVVRNGPAPGALRPTGDTVALVVADAEGRFVSLIQSLFDGFGSGILEPETGIVCHNRGALFSLDPASPNVLAGGKRPAHTLMPVLVHRDGRPVAALGTMGGGGQPQINFQNLVRVFDLGMTPPAALEAPRWLAGGMEVNVAERFVDAEARVPEGVRDTLAAGGYRVNVLDAVDEGVGHAHIIRVADGGGLEAATDPRADGEAAAREGYGPGTG